MDFACFLWRIRNILEQEATVILETVILDQVKLSEARGLCYGDDLLSALGKRHIGLELHGGEVRPEDFD
jgi:hypothetical protein